MSFETEYHRRIRRVLGVTDDETEVIVTEHHARTWQTGCDTCGYGADEYSIDVEIISWNTESRVVASRSFDSMDSFLAAVLKVDDE